VTKRLSVLGLGLLLFWVLAAYPVYRIWGEQVFVYTAVAAALCLVPTAATLAWGRWALRQSPQQQLVMVMGGTGVRMAVVLVGGLVLNGFEYFQRQSFWAALVVFYLASLSLEMMLLLTGRTEARDSE
jgi:hypothetical protein